MVCAALEDRNLPQILKSGCRAEESRLRTAERLANLVAILCILSWRIFWMTMINRSQPEATRHTGFTNLELHLLDTLIRDKADGDTRTKSLGTYLIKLARLGGYPLGIGLPPFLS
jgi:hypothetical protein